MASVTLENIRKEYPGGVEAVKGASFEVADGEFVVLVGPSGCGKSTTLRMVAGLESISGGVLKIGNEVVNDVAPKDRNIAMVFQNYALYPHMTVFDNMAFGLKLRKFPKSEIADRVNGAADTLGLTEYLDRKPKHLSGGQRQRVAVGRAIVREPEVFLFDEPLSNLDAKLRGEMRSEISRLHRDLKTTMLYVTHDQVEAMTMGDRIVILKDGVIQQVDSPMEIYKKPANVFVAGFIGSPPMNILPCKIEKESATCTISLSEDVKIQLPRNNDIDSGDYYFGVRPQDIELGEGKEHVSLGQGFIDNIEPLGGEIDYQISTSYGVLKARVKQVESKESIGAAQVLSCAPSKIHIFQKSEFGKRM